MAQANGRLSNHVKDMCRSQADRSTLIKAQLSTLNVATERGTSDKMETTRFSQCAHDQRRRLKAEDCDSICCAQLISGGRRRIRPPHCLAHAHPTMCCIRLVIMLHRMLSVISKIAIRSSMLHLPNSHSARHAPLPHALANQWYCRRGVWYRESTWQ